MQRTEQPGPLSPQAREQVAAIAARHRDRPGPLLEVLHEVQAALGCVPDAAVPEIAQALNLSRAEVHGVLSFYSWFRRTPGGRTTLRLCRAEACQAIGARTLEAHVRRRLGLSPGETSADGAVTLEAVYCLGLCACAPAAMIDGEVHGRLSTERLDELLGPGAAGAPR